jgi:alcohol dehydrogenase class IV
VTGSIHQFTLRTRVVHGLGCVTQLADIARELGISRPLIVGDPGLVAAGVMDRLSGIVRDGGLEPVVFTDVHHHAVDSEIDAAGEAGRDGACDGVIAVGGGTSLVTGRAAALLLGQTHTIAELEQGRDLGDGLAPTIAVPTTAGSGSEVSPFIPYISRSRERKVSLGGPQYRPHVAVLDGELLASLPPGQAAMSGVDALTHALEAFLSDRSTAITDALALAAAQTLVDNLREVVWTASAEARQRCLEASTMANMACGNALLGHVHTLARSVNTLYPEVPYGVTIGVLLVPVMEFNLPGAIGRFERLSDALGFRGGEVLTRRAHAERSISAIKRLLADLEFPRRFDLPAIDDAALERMTDLAFEGLYGVGDAGAAEVAAFVPGPNITRARRAHVSQLFRKARAGWELGDEFDTASS